MKVKVDRNCEKDSKGLVLGPALIVIFGITGDLSKRKLLPALYGLLSNGLLSENTRIVGITRQRYSKKELIEIATPGIKNFHGSVDDEIINRLMKKVSIYQMSSASENDYPGLSKYLDEVEEMEGICLTRMYYLAVPPQISGPIISNLGKSNMRIGCSRHGSLANLLLEKPFGFDTSTAKELIDITTKYFDEKQIFRIDHYLAKETVQNIISFRFNNPIFENVWNCSNIQSIEILAAEEIDIEGRGNFYEQVGALRDVIQNHLLHILSIIIMDRPDNLLSSESIHKARLSALESIEPIPDELVSEHSKRAQYDGYREEVDIPASYVETFASVLLYSNSSNWLNVPIFISTGKALNKKCTKISIKFNNEESDDAFTNELVFNIQPDEGITLKLWAKKPGYRRTLQSVPMQFKYISSFSGDIEPDAYERVLYDAINGDDTLFANSEEVMTSWRILQSVIDKWSVDDMDLYFYKKGTASEKLVIKLSG